MKYHNITKDDMLNGEGLRFVLWVSGCTHACKECHNPVTWNIDHGLLFDSAAKQELFDGLKKDYISGITLSGGDPMHPQNRSGIEQLVAEVKEKFPDKSIWMYTGFLWDELKNNDFIKYIDVIVDGPYIHSLQDAKLRWRGSRNQKVIHVAKSLEENTTVLYCE